MPPQTNTQLTPDAFKQGVMTAHPEYKDAVANDGTPYSTMDSTEFTKRFSQAYPDAITTTGHKYSDFLPQEPQTDSNQGFLSKATDVLNSIESPFVGLAATPIQAVAKAMGRPDPYSQGIPGLGNTKVPVSPLNVENKVGDLAQAGSYLVPGEGVLGAIGTGILQGAGSAMSKGEDIGSTVAEGALGGAIGGGAGGATKLLGTGINKIGESISGEGLQKALGGIKDAYSNALNLNASERAFENRSGKDLAQVLVDNKAPLGRNANNTLDASDAISQLKNKLQSLNEQADNLLSNPQGVVHSISLPDIQNSVHAKIDALNLPELDKVDAKNVASNYLASEAKKYGSEIPIDQADKIKQGFWASSFDKNRTNLQNHIPYLIGKELQGTTEKAVTGTDTGVNLHVLNQQRGDLIDAVRRLQKMDGVKLIRGGSLGEKMSGLTGTIIGSHFGPLQALAGDYFGGKAAELLSNPETNIGIAQAKAKASSIIPKLFGNTGVPIGKGISKLGNAIKSPIAVRGAGLISNLSQKK